MNENKKVFTHNYGGKTVSVETGRLAKQADAAVLVSCEGTEVLVTACSDRNFNPDQAFFPLMVEYTEKFYAAGKFLGGFLKREGRPSIQENLNARLIDRPIRPLFPKGYMYETVISCTVLSYNPKGDPEVLAGIGASVALSISDIPWSGPMATCKVGKIDGQFVLNPEAEDLEKSELDISIAGTSDAILMVEGESKELSEADVLEAINWGHEQIKGFVESINKMVAEVGKSKREYETVKDNEVLKEKSLEVFRSEAKLCLETVDKIERQNKVRALQKTMAEQFEKDPESFGLTSESNFKKEAAVASDYVVSKLMRTNILQEKKRIGDRRPDQVRQIETEVNVLTAPHGSSLFTRGETQVLSTVTIGGSSGDQMSDRIVGLNFDKFYLHYNFPPYCVGEARGVRGVGRREQGHGNLAQRALKAVMPSEEEFSYTTRIVCEVLESNGSSSMGSVCSGSMALMDAGVPIKKPVAGIAMGLIAEGDDFVILSDILGDEDHLGDMDFKVAGTADGVTAIQMDIKIAGLSQEIMVKAMDQAREGRLHILQEMSKTISSERKEMKDGVPRIESTKIQPDQIGLLIGPGGKNIKKLQETYEVNIECDEDGTVRIIGTDKEKIKTCLSQLELQINGPEVGSVYAATVVTIKEYGAFVDIMPGISGLVHVSELSDDRVNDVNEYVNEGDKIDVKVIEVDRMGRLKLSAKAVKALSKKS